MATLPLSSTGSQATDVKSTEPAKPLVRADELTQPLPDQPIEATVEQSVDAVHLSAEPTQVFPSIDPAAVEAQRLASQQQNKLALELALEALRAKLAAHPVDRGADAGPSAPAVAPPVASESITSTPGSVVESAVSPAPAAGEFIPNPTASESVPVEQPVADGGNPVSAALDALSKDQRAGLGTIDAMLQFVKDAQPAPSRIENSRSSPAEPAKPQPVATAESPEQPLTSASAADEALAHHDTDDEPAA